MIFRVTLMSALIVGSITASTCLAQDKQQAELRTSTGWEFLRNGQYADAATEFEKALNIDPANSSAGEGLGESAMQLKDWPRAKKGFDVALKAKPDNCTVKANLAYAELRLRHNARARDLYEEVVGPGGCNPNDNYSRNQLGIIYSKSKHEEDRDRAIQLFNKILASDEDDANILFQANYYQGRLYKLRKSYDRAIEFLEKAFTLQPQQTSGRYDLGTLYFNKENYSKALEHLQVAYKSKANDFNVNLMIGLCYYNMDDKTDEAIQYLQKAVNLVKLMKPADRPDKNLPHKYLADLYRQKDEPRKAIKTVDAGLRISKDEDGRAGLICSKAKALEDLGKYSEALDLFESVMSNKRWGGYARQQADRQEQLMARRAAGK